jgi:hypothetical protein
MASQSGSVKRCAVFLRMLWALVGIAKKEFGPDHTAYAKLNCFQWGRIPQMQNECPWNLATPSSKSTPSC